MKAWISSRAALLAAAAVIAIASVAAAALAVTPQGGAYLRAPTSHKYEGRATVAFLKVSGSGERVAKFWFPACDGKNKNPILKNLKISDDGKFSGEKEYREVSERGRSGGGGDYDVVWDWKVWVKGKFTAPTRAKGTLSSSYKSFLRDSETGEIRDEPGIDKYHTCTTGKATWNAKPAPPVEVR